MKHLISAAFFLCTLHAVAQPRLHTNFDDNWQFHFGNAANASKDFNYTIGNTTVQLCLMLIW